MTLMNIAARELICLIARILDFFVCVRSNYILFYQKSNKTKE